ncbi:lactoylglutathione lyase [Croceicoccus estronivorus]|uniref:VOC family protein n=1 Tax=Croceicoccus estronivorus TaxID=1172626 RepID=UPI000830A4A3|nr:VOC family protein [Croceicoccus estronivorus]OCC22649.1 lactoylglutathione lyase [Croceicoccus estronivorus]
MPKMIFVNLPVADLPHAKAFYEAIGFRNEPRFTDETAAAMQWSETIVVMLLTHEKWKTFTDRPLPAPGSSEVMLCVNCESRDEVDNLTITAAAHGGTADVNPAQDHGFMMSRTFADPDGHVWEPMWMDPAVAGSESHISEAHA